MKALIALVLIVSSAWASGDVEDDQAREALQNPDLFEGDILGIDPHDRNVIPYSSMRWTNKTIPYVIDASLEKQTSLIELAMEDYHNYTCVRFVPRTDEKDYIKIFKGKGCYSYVGCIKRGEQIVSLGYGCHYKGTIVHELGHAVGFFHEQNRSDRDDHLIIHWDNIKPGMESQFKLLKPRQNLLYTPFDHRSIMLYGNYAFAKDREAMTMEARNGKILLEPHSRKGLTLSDAKRVRYMYKC